MASAARPVNWIYLYSAVVILRDVSVTPNGMKYKFPKGVISIVNSFPAAYIISTDKETCGLCDLFDMCSENIDEIVEIVIDLNVFWLTIENYLIQFLIQVL